MRRRMLGGARRHDLLLSYIYAYVYVLIFGAHGIGSISGR